MNVKNIRIKKYRSINVALISFVQCTCAQKGTVNIVRCRNRNICYGSDPDPGRQNDAKICLGGSVLRIRMFFDLPE